MEIRHRAPFYDNEFVCDGDFCQASVSVQPCAAANRGRRGLVIVTCIADQQCTHPKSKGIPLLERGSIGEWSGFRLSVVDGVCVCTCVLLCSGYALCIWLICIPNNRLRSGPVFVCASHLMVCSIVHAQYKTLRTDSKRVCGYCCVLMCVSVWETTASVCLPSSSLALGCIEV